MSQSYRGKLAASIDVRCSAIDMRIEWADTLTVIIVGTQFNHMNTPLQILVRKSQATLFIWTLAALTALALITTSVHAATATATVTIVGNGTVSPNYNGQQLIIGKSYKMKAKPLKGYGFAGWTGTVTSSATKISFVMVSNLNLTATFADLNKPTAVIKTPANNSIFTNPAVTITGSAKDKFAVTQVFYQLNGSSWTLAKTGNAWANWWADFTLEAGANVIQAYAVDTSSNLSTIQKITLTYRAAPDAISGQTLVISSTDAADFSLTFDDTTFSQNANDTNSFNGVGTYTFVRKGPTTGNLAVKYTAPFSVANTLNTVSLQFTDASSGWFINNDGSTNTFVLSDATSTAPATVAATEFNLVSTNGEPARILAFTAEPTILGSGTLANPLAINISTAFEGNIGDRVSALFSHFNGTVNVTNDYPGTAIGTTSGTSNTVTVLFDSSSFASTTYPHQLLTGIPLQVLTFYYTNNASTAGSGTHDYFPYSPVGGLLELAQTNLNYSYILNFDDTGDSGSYYAEFEPTGGGPIGFDAGYFSLISAPQIITQPHNIAVTNGASANFTVVASGSAPLSYQWLKNNVSLTDGTNSFGTITTGSSTNRLTLSPITTNDVANYRVIVGNLFGTVTSSVASLSIKSGTNSVPTP
jgi:hypothetical protein